MAADILELSKDFIEVTRLAGIPLSADNLNIESLRAPHKPPTRLPAGKMAVYVFYHRGRALKIGKAGPNSNARYTSQHYSVGAANSTLAASILKHGREIGISEAMEPNIGNWIKENTDRYNILLDSSYPIRELCSNLVYGRVESCGGSLLKLGCLIHSSARGAHRT